MQFLKETIWASRGDSRSKLMVLFTKSPCHPSTKYISFSRAL